MRRLQMSRIRHVYVLVSQRSTYIDTWVLRFCHRQCAIAGMEFHIWLSKGVGHCVGDCISAGFPSDACFSLGFGPTEHLPSSVITSSLLYENQYPSHDLRPRVFTVSCCANAKHVERKLKSPNMKGKYCPGGAREYTPLTLFHFRISSIARIDKKQDVDPKRMQPQR
jgi:hypothetical protein